MFGVPYGTEEPPDWEYPGGVGTATPPMVSTGVPQLFTPLMVPDPPFLVRVITGRAAGMQAR